MNVPPSLSGVTVNTASPDPLVTTGDEDTTPLAELLVSATDTPLSPSLKDTVTVFALPVAHAETGVMVIVGMVIVGVEKLLRHPNALPFGKDPN